MTELQFHQLLILSAPNLHKLLSLVFYKFRLFHVQVNGWLSTKAWAPTIPFMLVDANKLCIQQ